MPNTLKEAIIANRFSERLRSELVVDDDQYRSLCVLLRKLIDVWERESKIDKELMAHLYLLSPSIKGVADGFKTHLPELALQIDIKASEVDALIWQCLAGREPLPV